MSDDRFDEDLRSVLTEDAPRDVPDDLRRRVAAIPSAPSFPTRPSRAVWRQPFPIGFAALGALVIVVAVGFWRLTPADLPGPGGPGPSSSVVAPSATPPASREPGGACLATDLAGQILDWQGAAGSRIADVAITNTSAGECLVQGAARLELLDANGQVLIDSAVVGPKGQVQVSPTDAPIQVSPGGRLQTEVVASNYCGSAPSLPLAIALTLPAGGGQVVATPGPGVSSSDAVPPCLGSTGGSIAMNGWRK